MSDLHQRQYDKLFSRNAVPPKEVEPEKEVVQRLATFQLDDYGVHGIQLHLPVEEEDAQP